MDGGAPCIMESAFMEGPRAVRMGATCSFRVLHESQYADIDGGSMLGCLAALRSVHTAQAASVDGNGKALPIVRSTSSAAHKNYLRPSPKNSRMIRLREFPIPLERHH